MAKEMYSKYLAFLTQYKLFDYNVFQYIQKRSVLIPYYTIRDSQTFGCATILDTHGRLVDFIPCIPPLINDKAIAIHIFVYVQAILLLPKIGKTYDEREINYILPFSFFKLYILHTNNESLLKYSRKIIQKHFKENSPEEQENLIQTYCQNPNFLNLPIQKAKRKVKNYNKSHIII